jgi:hypothetical protein
MATATLTFNLTDPDDREDHARCVKSLEMAKVIYNFMYNTKKGVKYSIEAEQQKDPSFDCYDAVDMVFSKFYEMLQDESISIDDIYN